METTELEPEALPSERRTIIRALLAFAVLTVAIVIVMPKGPNCREIARVESAKGLERITIHCKEPLPDHVLPKRPG
jgi:hypothetical protein